MLKDLFNNPETSNVVKWHHYTDIYEFYFSKFKGQRITILEIGVLDGGSLKLWKSYFGECATVIGIDLVTPSLCEKIDGIHIEKGDQSDPIFISNLIDKYGPFDIVIDDGGHTNFLVKRSFELLFNSTNKLYIVEDTHALLWYKGFHSFIRDLHVLVCQNVNFIHRIINVFKLLLSLLSGRYFFYSYAYKLAKRITNSRHKKPYKKFHRGEKLSFSVKDSNENLSKIYSINFYDSLIIFTKANIENVTVEYK